MHITATEAKNRFGSVCAQAKREPVFVEKAGRVDTVICSAEHYQALQAAKRESTLSARQTTFNAEFADWIEAQNALVESAGIPGADLRPW